MEQQCQLAEVSRAGFYRYLQQVSPKQADLLLRARLQELAVAHHRLRGYRVLTALLPESGAEAPVVQVDSWNGGSQDVTPTASTPQ